MSVIQSGQQLQHYINKFIPHDKPLSTTSCIYKRAQEIISEAWNFSYVINYNPSPHPISLDKKLLPQLDQQMSDYMIAEKSDGVRYLMVLGSFENKGFCVMVNRKMQMFEISIFANEEYFRGSVFDGEMLLENVSTSTQPLQTHSSHSSYERQIFLVYDLICVRGESRLHMTFLERYNEYFQIFDLEGRDILENEMSRWEIISRDLAKSKSKIVCLGNKFALQFAPKPFVQLVNLGSLWRSMSTLKHKSDGLVISKISAPIGTGTDINLLKWKQHHTIDVIIRCYFAKSKWTCRMFFQNADVLVENTIKPFEIIIQQQQQQQYYLQIKENNILQSTYKYYADKRKLQFNLIGECLCDFDLQQPVIWCSVIKWRRDKITPNNYTVIQRTLNNIIDNVTIEELISISNKHLYH
jgi:mRNA capping enzyme, catalytic domain/mRNA capping enzyme, C-terminal domain